MTPERFKEGLAWEAFLARCGDGADPFVSRYEEARPDDACVQRLRSLDHQVNVVVLAEDWCGDVVRNIPVLARLFADQPRITFRIFWASEYKDIWERHLTDGSWSIPKLIVYDEQFRERGSWGPRPAECQRILTENRSTLSMSEIYSQIRDWYESNEDRDLVREVTGLVLESQS